MYFSLDVKLTFWSSFCFNKSYKTALSSISVKIKLLESLLSSGFFPQWCCSWNVLKQYTRLPFPIETVECWWLIAIGKHQGVTPFASQPITSSPTWIISSSTCAVFFPCVRAHCTTSCFATTTWSKEGSHGLYHQRRTIGPCVQTTREPALKKKNGSVDFCRFTCFRWFDRHFFCLRLMC